MVKIGKYINPNQREELINLINEFLEIFAYEDMNGINHSVCEHLIRLLLVVSLVAQRPYQINPNYTKQVKQ